MGRSIKSARFWSAVVIAVMVTALLIVVAVGCGDDTTTTTKTATTKAAGQANGKIYVAVTGSGEATAGTGPMGYAVVDLKTKKVEMVNLPDSKAPHGIIFTADTKTAPRTAGKVTTEQPKGIYIGNATDGSVLKVDLSDNKVTKTITDKPGIKVCGMQMGPDGLIYLSAMADGKAYPLDGSTDTIGDAKLGGAPNTNSICGVSWTLDNKYVYLSNMSDPKNPTGAGFVAKYEWPSGAFVKRIENVTKPSPTGATLAHQSEMTPDGKYLYVMDSIDGAVVKIDTATDEIVKTVPVGKDPHAMVFSSDGKTGYIAVRKEPDEKSSSIFVYDVEKDQVIDRIPGIPVPQVCSLILWEQN
ncbi:MAG: YncE family protein [Thermoleophilia bacterium]